MNNITSDMTVKETIFDVIIEMTFIALVFLVPVVFDRRVGIVFSLTKVSFMRLLLIAITVVWILKILLKNKHNFVRSPLDWSVASYMLACTAAMVTSVHVVTSLIGFYGRYEGLSTLWMYGLLYYIALNFIRRKEQMKRILYTVLSAAVFMSIYSIMQRAKLDPFAWGGVVTWQRVIGTIGQPNFLAAYVDMAFIIGLAVLINIDMGENGSSNKEKLTRIILDSIVIIGLTLIYTCILFTQSRGGFLGLAAGVSLFIFSASKDVIIKNWKKVAILFTFIFVISFITMLNPEYSPIARAAYEAERMEESQAQETPVIKYSAALSRLETWKSGYRIIGAYPIFGIGQEVLKMIFPQYETEFFRFYEGFHVKQDRMHNEICDMGVTRGVITLAIYVWMLGVFFWLGIKIVSSDKDPEMKLFVAAMMGAAVAYLVQNQFSFGVVAITTLLWIMMGMTASIHVGEPIVERKEFNWDPSDIPWLYGALLLITGVIFGYLSMLQFRGDIYFKSGKMLSQSRMMNQAVYDLEKSIKILPCEGSTWTHLGITYLNVAQSTGKADLLDRAISIFVKASEIDPYNADNFYIMGRAYLLKSMYGGDYLKEVLRAEENALKIDPKYAEAYQVRGAVYDKMGDSDKAFEMFKRSLEINPSQAEAANALQNISVRKGKYDSVIEVFQQFLKTYPNNLLYLENLALAYVRKGDLPKAERTFLQMLKVEPKNIRGLVNLGFTYVQQGNLGKAFERFEDAVMVDPRNVDAHNGLGLVALMSGNNAKAKEEFNQSLMLDPNNQYAKKMLENIKQEK